MTKSDTDAAIAVLHHRIDGLIDKMKVASSTNEYGDRIGNVLQLLEWTPILKAMCQAVYTLHEIEERERFGLDKPGSGDSI